MTGSFKKIPILDSATASAAAPEMRGCAEAEPFALRVIGDSMAPEFLDGHIIIVDPAMPAQSGAFVVINYQGETAFRQYVIESGRKLLRTLSGDTADVELVGTYQIRGVVVQRAGRRRKDHKHYY